jgi:large subunit ribosomal protein L23
MKDPHKVILSQVISEKGTDLAARNNQYLFRVAPEVNKIEIKQAVESIYNVNVQSVQVINRPGKPKRRGYHVGRTSGYRRAVVRLKAGESISLT